MLFRSSIARPTNALAYASTETSRLNRKTQGQDGVRFLLSCKALSSSTTCRFIPAHPQAAIEWPTKWFYKKGCQEKKLPRELEAAKSFGIQPPKSLCRWLEA
jgi:hypothetical protein